MNQRLAKRWACTHAAMILRSHIEHGYPHSEKPEHQEHLSNALLELEKELRKRGLTRDDMIWIKNEFRRLLRLWLDGNPVHNDEYDECCPDFSCCAPDLLASKTERENYCKASQEERIRLLRIFLKRMLDSQKENNSEFKI